VWVFTDDANAKRYCAPQRCIDESSLFAQLELCQTQTMGKNTQTAATQAFQQKETPF